ncbi:MAG: RNA methyltransferase PUA domain-containing protein, partial [Pseudomonas sp.]
MTVARLYHSGELHAGREIILDAPAAHHAVKVLRLKPGDALVLFDGQGGEYP